MSDLTRVFAIQRNIFGVCPCCGHLFRLSDCRVYLKTRPKRDWMDVLDAADEKLNEIDAAIDEQEQSIREEARERGRRLAQRQIRKIDTVFAPLRLSADDAKVLFHPVDYVVFKGMNSAVSMNSILFLDRETREPDRRRLQRSIEKVVEKGHYEWLTHRL